MFKFTCILLIITLNINNSFQFLKHGRCPYVRSNPFNLFPFQGKWYEVLYTPHPTIIPQKCAMNKILYNNVDTATITNKHITSAKIYQSKQGSLHVLRDHQPFYTSLEIVYPGVLSKQYQIVATDYSCYAILYSCTPITLGINRSNEVQCIIWSRYPIITPAIRSIIKAALVQKRIQHCEEYFHECDQHNCPR